MKKPARELREGDLVDLELLGVFGFDKDSGDYIAAQCEYGVVEGTITLETVNCVRVDFENFPSIGLPPDFLCTVDSESES